MSEDTFYRDEIIEPDGFSFVAGRIREGIPDHKIRDEIIEVTSMRRLPAGKLVEDARKTIRLAKAGVFGGIGMIVVAGLFMIIEYSAGILDFKMPGLMALGAAGVAGAWKPFTKSRTAVADVSMLDGLRVGASAS